VTDHGLFPRWFHDGRRLLFQIWNPPTLVAADLETGKTFPLFSGDAAFDVVSGVRLTHDDRQAYFLRSRCFCNDLDRGSEMNGRRTAHRAAIAGRW
jgi:hypothetical protein